MLWAISVVYQRNEKSVDSWAAKSVHLTNTLLFANILSKKWVVHIEMVQADVIVGEISTFQREKCLAML